MEKLDLKMDSYEEKNGLLEGRNALNEMTISRLEELIKTLAEKTARIDVIQTNMDLLVTKNSQNKMLKKKSEISFCRSQSTELFLGKSADFKIDEKAKK